MKAAANPSRAGAVRGGCAARLPRPFLGWFKSLRASVLLLQDEEILS